MQVFDAISCILSQFQELFIFQSNITLTEEYQISHLFPTSGRFFQDIRYHLVETRQQREQEFTFSWYGHEYLTTMFRMAQQNTVILLNIFEKMIPAFKSKLWLCYLKGNQWNGDIGDHQNVEFIEVLIKNLKEFVTKFKATRTGLAVWNKYSDLVLQAEIGRVFYNSSL